MDLVRGSGKTRENGYCDTCQHLDQELWEHKGLCQNDLSRLLPNEY